MCLFVPIVPAIDIVRSTGLLYRSRIVRSIYGTDKI